MRRPNKYPNLEALAKGVQLAMKPTNTLVKIKAGINTVSNGEYCYVQISNTALSNWDIKEIERKILTGEQAYIRIAGYETGTVHLTFRVNELKPEYIL
jgi:hypothetical protein